MPAENETQKKVDPEDLDALNAYLTEMDQLAKQEPAYDFSDPKSAEAWEKWNQKTVAVNKKYHDSIMKALTASMDLFDDDPMAVPGLIRACLSDDLEERKKAAKLIHSKLMEVYQYALMRDKTSREMIASMPTVREVNGQMQLVWGANQAPKNAPQVPVYITLTNTDGAISTSKRITAFDNAVMLAVANLIFVSRSCGETGPWNITPQDVWRQMKFGTIRIDKDPTQKEINEICKSIDKMRTTMITIDFTAEIQAGYIHVENLPREEYKGGVIDDYYIDAGKGTLITKKNREIPGYSVREMPPLFDYNLGKGHIVLVDSALLDVSDTIKKSGDYVTEFKNYLLLQIQNIYAGYRDSTKILYETVYHETGIPTPEERISKAKYAKEKSYKAAIYNLALSDRGKIKDILQSFKNKHWITDFKDARDGRAIVGVHIVLNPDRPQKALDEKNAQKKLDAQNEAESEN